VTGINLLGATGSVGRQAIEVIQAHPGHFRLSAMSVGKNIPLARKIIEACQPKVVSVQRKEDCERLKSEYGHRIKFYYGEEGLAEVAAFSEGEIFLNGISGAVGIVPTIRAIEAGKRVALANKETLVTAGHIVMKKAEERRVPIIPVDSEHSAIFQALQGERRKNIEKIILTASGGSFRDKKREELADVTVEDALKHPNWSMGAKITVDSATMMNKGMEVIEARWLFDLPYDKIAVLLHRESTVHSMVQFHDGSIIAQLGTPDMRIPIQYALTYPDRLPLLAERLDLAKLGVLHFSEMDFDRFRCLRMAYEAGRTGGTMPAVLNAANEEAVHSFLEGKIPFLAIEEWVERAMEQHEPIPDPTLEAVLEADKETRALVRSFLKN